jgi:hypothetical protein
MKESKKESKGNSAVTVIPDDSHFKVKLAVVGDPSIKSAFGLAIGDNVSYEPITGSTFGVVVAFDAADVYVCPIWDKFYATKMKGFIPLPFDSKELTKTKDTFTVKFHQPVGLENVMAEDVKPRKKSPIIVQLKTPAIVQNTSGSFFDVSATAAYILQSTAK